MSYLIGIHILESGPEVVEQALQTPDQTIIGYLQPDSVGARFRFVLENVSEETGAKWLDGLSGSNVTVHEAPPTLRGECALQEADILTLFGPTLEKILRRAGGLSLWLRGADLQVFADGVTDVAALVMEGSMQEHVEGTVQLAEASEEQMSALKHYFQL